MDATVAGLGVTSLPHPLLCVCCRGRSSLDRAVLLVQEAPSGIPRARMYTKSFLMFTIHVLFPSSRNAVMSTGGDAPALMCSDVCIPERITVISPSHNVPIHDMIQKSRSGILSDFG